MREVIQLEQWLMEGAYNKVLAARQNLPRSPVRALHGAAGNDRAVRLAALCMILSARGHPHRCIWLLHQFSMQA